jgi:hypothetical protein
MLRPTRATAAAADLAAGRVVRPRRAAADRTAPGEEEGGRNAETPTAMIAPAPRDDDDDDDDDATARAAAASMMTTIAVGGGGVVFSVRLRIDMGVPVAL